jgi:two-component system, response regulator, stage 0 sporulation protein F
MTQDYNSKPTSPSKLKNILIIDDEAMTLKMTKQGLERSGFNVAIFSRPQESLEYFKTHHEIIDLVITDKNMPQMSGVQIIEEFRKFNKDVPIFVLTGFSDPAEDETMKKIGATKILMKPLSIRDIIKEINDVTTCQ